MLDKDIGRGRLFREDVEIGRVGPSTVRVAKRDTPWPCKSNSPFCKGK